MEAWAPIEGPLTAEKMIGAAACSCGCPLQLRCQRARDPAPFWPSSPTHQQLRAAAAEADAAMRDVRLEARAAEADAARLAREKGDLQDRLAATRVGPRRVGVPGGMPGGMLCAAALARSLAGYWARPCSGRTCKPQAGCRRADPCSRRPAVKICALPRASPPQARLELEVQRLNAELDTAARRLQLAAADLAGEKDRSAALRGVLELKVCILGCGGFGGRGNA